MITILGADWCQGCEIVKEELEKRDMEYRYVCIPFGQAGWDMVEQFTGTREIPQIFYKFKNPKVFLEQIQSTGEVKDD
jgi:glutaredoxin